MMSWNKYLPAFSLIELVVVMVLSGVVIGMVYYSFHITQFSFTKFLESRKKQESFHMMSAQLERDFFRSDSIVFREQAIRCHLNGRAVFYSISETGIVRHQNSLADTLKIHIEVSIGRFNNEEVQSGWIDELFIKYRDERAQNVMHFVKKYDAASMLSYRRNKTK